MDKRVEKDSYDRKIIPAETAARMEREGDAYKHIPEQSSGDIDTMSGMTVDSEGLLNNYAVEPEMYYEVPGDRAAILEQEEAARQEELAEINETDEDGKLTLEKDQRGRGVGII
jgi:hypothetical protein